MFPLLDEIYNLKTRQANQQTRDVLSKQRLERLLNRFALPEKKEG